MTDSHRPQLTSGFRLQWEPAQNAHVLLYPEGMIKLNISAGEILRRCDGERTVAELVEDLERTFNKQGLLKDVNDFIAIATGNGWLRNL
ncbi:MAG: pyrroloquinoline quinone biosynthesis peptide chaperone PqqD [Candidatus Obscuribacterales bacterium]|nr:pyrroloquinoline quinone biosynthesis peptide chaperone PqqD [Steroidobacteraceae bacterium]